MSAKSMGRRILVRVFLSITAVLLGQAAYADVRPDSFLPNKIRATLNDLQQNTSTPGASVHQQLIALARESTKWLDRPLDNPTESEYHYVEGVNRALVVLADLSHHAKALPSCQAYYKEAKKQYTEDVSVQNGNTFYEVFKAYRKACTDPNWLWEKDNLIRFDLYHRLDIGRTLVESIMHHAADLCSPLFDGYYVFEGVYREGDTAIHHVEQLENTHNLTATSFHFIDFEDRKLRMVLLGKYGSLQDAQQALFTLQAARHSGAYILDYENPSYDACQYHYKGMYPVDEQTTEERYIALLDDVADMTRPEARYKALQTLGEWVLNNETKKLYEINDDPNWSQAYSEMTVSLEPIYEPFAKRNTCSAYLAYMRLQYGIKSKAELSPITQKVYEVYQPICKVD